MHSGAKRHEAHRRVELRLVQRRRAARRELPDLQGAPVKRRQRVLCAVILSLATQLPGLGGGAVLWRTHLAQHILWQPAAREKADCLSTSDLSVLVFVRYAEPLLWKAGHGSQIFPNRRTNLNGAVCGSAYAVTVLVWS